MAFGSLCTFVFMCVQAAGWESWMQGRVEEARRNEARALRKQQLMGTGNMWLGWVAQHWARAMSRRLLCLGFEMRYLLYAWGLGEASGICFRPLGSAREPLWSGCGPFEHKKWGNGDGGPQASICCGNLLCGWPL